MHITVGHGMGLGLAPLGSDSPVTPPPPPPPPTVTTLSDFAANGWSATYPAPPAFDPHNTPETFTVTRRGFDATGMPTTPRDTLTIMARLRQPYPDQNTLTPDQVALSDFIYDGDVVAGVQNNSTRAYPLPIAMWLNHDHARATSATHTLRLAVAHGTGRNGRPVAAVKFTASDGTTTVEQTVSGMSTITYPASGLSVPHFAADMDLSTLAQGSLLTIDAVIYPWVGEAFTISQDADVYPSPNLTTLRVFNDRTGGYGTAYAYVDASAGNNATGVASGTAATARAAPFADMRAAATAVKAFNNAQYGRNTLSGGVIRLEAGLHTYTNIRLDGGTLYNVPVLVEAADESQKASTILQDSGASQAWSMPNRWKIRGLTIRKTVGSATPWDTVSAQIDGRMVIVQDCIWDLNGRNKYAGWWFRIGMFYQINNTGDAGQNGLLAAYVKCSILIGCQLDNAYGAYAIAGCRATNFTEPAVAGNRPAPLGIFIGFNVFSSSQNGARIVGHNTAIGPRGLAVVGNVIESWGPNTSPALQINADGNVNAAQNVVIAHNTVIGQRLNFLYMDTDGNAEKSAYVRANVFQTMNVKGDVFAAQSANTGNWPVRYKTGWSHNAALSGSNNGYGYTPTSWMGEIASLGEVEGVAPVWVNDQSNTGGDAGGGDYTPGQGSALPALSSDIAVYPVDLEGRAIVPGTGYAGAVQPI